MRLGRRSFLAAVPAAFVQPARAADLDVAIVGAGAAGFAAAHALIGARKSVILLEARDRTGGRIYTDTSLGQPFEQGAPGRPLPEPPLLMVDGRPLGRQDRVRFEKARAEFGRTLEKFRTEAPGLDPQTMVHTADPVEQLALADLVRRPPFPPLASLPVAAGKMPVRIGMRVTAIDSTGPLVRLTAPAAEVTARAVIVTVPVGVLATGGPTFVPPLGAGRRAAIAALPMAWADKIYLTFSRRVIDTADDVRLLARGASGRTVEALLRPGGREAAILFHRDEEAQRFEAEGPSAATADAVAVLAELFGQDVRTAFLRSAATRWGQDPLARGAWAEGSVDARAVLAAPHDDRVLFAGEATDPAGGVAGATASGLRAAKEALAVLSNHQ